ncbi:MAG: 5-formyltetrahydrofolate cyclo-ligase [Rhodospirillales bacterium]|nr:5-formyltetrahydrofolate cyclo-ligase [Rhodospirillales bacterium]
MSADNDKTTLRCAARTRRKAAFDLNAASAARSLAGHVLALLEERPPATIAGYWAIGSEIDLTPLMIRLVEKSWQVALPVVVQEASPLIFRRWSAGDELIEGPLKTVQPKPDRDEVIPDVIVTPLLAFDNQGYRLGQGGGFYDRTLANLKRQGDGVLSIGVAFVAQRVDRVPRDDFDQRLDFIVTEQGRV